ncbi:hypothetical protein [Halorubrum trapanicum]|uniref:hypothetical protein n=1 Tax=Halorubrum trapanicum TaxID=29284 RepID=UPI001AE998A4|nr:hypothetical protein [Halorubrum trapanicum]
MFNLHELYEILIRAEAGEVTDRHKMQLLYLRRATSPLLTVYLSAKNHLYSVAYGQIRLLLELYLGVRELNRDKDQTEKKFVEFREDLNENEYGDYETLPMTDFFGGKVGQVKGDFKDQHELQRSLYGRISNLGTHPYSIKSTGNDGTYSESQEKDVLDFALIFAYGIAAQYIRTFENSEAEQFVRQEADQVIIQSILATRTLPLFFEEDLEFDFNY